MEAWYEKAGATKAASVEIKKIVKYITVKAESYLSILSNFLRQQRRKMLLNPIALLIDPM